MDRLKYSCDHSDYKKSDCLTAYFDQGEAAWEEVVLAVAQPPVNNVDLASNIAQKYIVQESNQAKVLQCCI